MTDITPAAPPAANEAVVAAIETLVAELEREHAWLDEIRADAKRAERTCQRLLASVEAALDTLPMRARQPFYTRVMRMRNETRPLGRPARDPRHAAVLEFLAERGRGMVSNAETRAQLERRGLSPKPAYVSNLLATLAQEGMVTRTGHGRYEINANHPRLQHIRWRTAHQAETEAAKADTAGPWR